jgi:heme iron utilization protein
MTVSTDLSAEIRAALAENPGAVLEDIARRFGVTMRDLIGLLPPREAVTVPGSRFEEVMGEMTTWGDLTFLVNTGDVIVEVRGPLPEGIPGQGWYNLQGRPLGGHIKADACELIAFVSRKLFSSDTHSVQFFNGAGACMFKLYLGRDAERRLIPEQVGRFLALRDRLALGGPEPVPAERGPG